MKKGSYWFAFLSEKEQEEFKNECEIQEKDFEYRMERKFFSFSGFILGSFDWSRTRQGYEYWYKISKRDVQ